MTALCVQNCAEPLGNSRVDSTYFTEKSSKARTASRFAELCCQALPVGILGAATGKAEFIARDQAVGIGRRDA